MKIKFFVLCMLAFLTGAVAPSAARDSAQGEAMKNMLLGMFGTVMQGAQCEMLQQQAKRAGQPIPPCGGGAAPAAGYQNESPPLPELPPLPNDSGWVRTR